MPTAQQEDRESEVSQDPEWFGETHLFLPEVGPVPAHRHPNGGGWVANTATVADTAYVGRQASVFDFAQVLDRASVDGTAWVRGNAVVMGNAKIRGDSVVDDDALVSGDALIAQSAFVSGEADVRDASVVSGTAMVTGRSILWGYAKVDGKDVEVRDKTIGGPGPIRKLTPPDVPRRDIRAGVSTCGDVVKGATSAGDGGCTSATVSKQVEWATCEICGRSPAIPIKLRTTGGYVVYRTIKTTKRPIALCKVCGLDALHHAQKVSGVGVATLNVFAPYALAQNQMWIGRLKQLPDPS